MIAAVDGDSLVQIAIILVGSGGIAGAIVALLKLKPEANSAAVSQAQGAMEMQQALNEDLRADRDYWREEAKSRGRRIIELEEKIKQLNERIDEHDMLWGNGS